MAITFVRIDAPGATGTVARGINNAGQIVGSYDDVSGTQGFLLSGGNYTTLNDPAFTLFHDTVACGINNSSQIAGYFLQGFSYNVFLYSNGNYSNLTSAAGTQGGYFGQGINDGGQIVGYDYFRVSPTFFTNVEGFIYNHGSFTRLDDPDAIKGPPGGLAGTFAQGINNAGQVVGTYDAPDYSHHGFLYSGGTYTTLDDPLGARGTYATAINDSGQIVGSFTDANGGVHGFLCSGGTYTTIDDPQATGGTFINGINDFGQIVGDYVDASGTHGFVGILPPPPPPSDTTAVMIADRASTGDYEIYDIGHNAQLAAHLLTNIPSAWQPVALGNFAGTDSSDLVVRNGAVLQYYDVANNTVTQTGVMGAVGTEWSFVGTGKFDSTNYTDIMMEKTSGAVETYDAFIVRNNQFVAANQIAAVGSDWQLLGCGDVNGDGTADMLLRNANNGTVEYYDIANGQAESAGVLGSVGLEWQIVGVGKFDNLGFGSDSDMIMRNSNNGAYDLFDIRDNHIVGAHQIAAVGSEWQLAGFADVNGDGTTDMVLRDTNNGVFEYYDIVNGEVTAEGVLDAVGTEWSVVGLTTVATPSFVMASDPGPSSFIVSDPGPASFTTSDPGPSSFIVSDPGPSSFMTSDPGPSSFMTSDPGPSSFMISDPGPSSFLADSDPVGANGWLTQVMQPAPSEPSGWLTKAMQPNGASLSGPGPAFEATSGFDLVADAVPLTAFATPNPLQHS